MIPWLESTPAPFGGGVGPEFIKVLEERGADVGPILPLPTIPEITIPPLFDPPLLNGVLNGDGLFNGLPGLPLPKLKWPDLIPSVDVNDGILPSLSGIKTAFYAVLAVIGVVAISKIFRK